MLPKDEVLTVDEGFPGSTTFPTSAVVLASCAFAVMANKTMIPNAAKTLMHPSTGGLRSLLAGELYHLDCGGEQEGGALVAAK
jgi:hypothetical protein